MVMMLRFLTAGESHGPCLTAIVEGLPAGLKVDVAAINRDLARRQGGYGRGGRMKIEHDRVEVLGGVLYGKTTGAPVALRIENRDWENWRERWATGDQPKLTVPRPGHADYAGMVKYNLDDARPVLERASARETAARVAVGALAKQLLAAFDVAVGSYVVEIGAVVAPLPELPARELWALAEESDVRCPDREAAARMRAAIDAAREAAIPWAASSSSSLPGCRWGWAATSIGSGGSTRGWRWRWRPFPPSREWRSGRRSRTRADRERKSTTSSGWWTKR